MANYDIGIEKRATAEDKSISIKDLDLSNLKPIYKIILVMGMLFCTIWVGVAIDKPGLNAKDQLASSFLAGITVFLLGACMKPEKNVIGYFPLAFIYVAVTKQRLRYLFCGLGLLLIVLVPLVYIENMSQF